MYAMSVSGVKKVFHKMYLKTQQIGTHFPNQKKRNKLLNELHCFTINLKTNRFGKYLYSKGSKFKIR